MTFRSSLADGESGQGDVLHNDHTMIKILELMKERAEQNLAEDTDEQTGIFTLGVAMATSWGVELLRALRCSGAMSMGMVYVTYLISTQCQN